MLPSLLRRPRQAASAAALAFLFALASTLVASANVALTQLSSDPYTNSTSQHKTEVEPDSFSFGSTVVSTIQVGRFTDGGSSNIAWATSTNGGASWTNGFLPGITVYQGGTFARATDPSVAYDAAHNVWLINSLALTQSGSTILGAADLVNRSTDGGLTWGNPVTIAAVSGNQNFDKNWIVCDDTATSPFYGRCYAEFDDNGNGNLLKMYYSTNGGQTWTASTVPSSTVIGGQPVVQPNGTVVMPIDNANETAIESFRSTNGGVSYSGPSSIATIRSHTEAGSLRSGPLPSAEIDSSGKVYVVWADCRFRSGCRANDLVMSTSTNGTSWSAVTRIPIDGTGSGIDHFLPGIAVDKATSGSTAHLGVTYYYYPNTSCTASSCRLDVGFVSSTNGGSSWTAATQLAGPMTLSWLPNTTQGRMVGDYISSSFVNGTAFGFFANASAPSGSTFNETLNTNTAGLSAPLTHAPLTPTVADPILSNASDHPAPAAPVKIR